MRLPVRLAAKLYPRLWRERYGEEFDALLDDTGSNGRIFLDVVLRAAIMQFQRWWKVGASGALVAALVALASLWAGRNPHITPGTHQIFRMDSTPGALLEFLVILALAVAGIATLARAPRAGRIFAGVALAYAAALIAVSLTTPQTIVSIGDSYCWDLWCFGINEVSAAPQGANTLYTADVSLFVDSTTAQLELSSQPNQFFYAMDERGRRFSVETLPLPGTGHLTLNPGDMVKASLTFVAPSNARRLYLTGDVKAPLWVRMYFASDLSPLHRRTLLRVV